MKPEKGRIVFSVEVFIERDEDEYHAFCPNLKGLHTCGKTLNETIENAKDAVIAYLNSLIKHGEPIPLTRIKGKERPAPEMAWDSVCSHDIHRDLIQVTL
mgnify:CR=1 FL=1